MYPMQWDLYDRAMIGISPDAPYVLAKTMPRNVQLSAS
jgi:hypothetical protein